MKVINILKNQKPSLSFEVFPPKKETSFESVERAVQAIAAIKPAYMSVTYGAGGGTSKYTLEIAKSIKEKYGVETVEHLTCVSSRKWFAGRLKPSKKAALKIFLRFAAIFLPI